MPGISLRYDLNKNNLKGGLENRDELFLEASNSIIYNNYYQREVFLTNPCHVVCTRYPEYPVKIFENQEFWACLEGKIYGKSEIAQEREITDLIETVFSTQAINDNQKKILADWLLETDGDFVLYFINKQTNDFFLINDLLGRLPLYYYLNNDSELIVSREIRLMSTLKKGGYIDGIIFDVHGIAQFLLFSHTLGRRTLLQNISRLGPATLLIIYNNIPRVEIHSLYVFNFENRVHSNNSIKRNVQGLVPLFFEACKNRVDQNAKNLISLSGGLDSRAIAAVLSQSKIKCFAVTSPEPNWKPVSGNSSETDVAEKLADKFDIECQKYDIMIPRASDISMLLRSKNGLVYLAHSFLPRFLGQIQENHKSGSINFFTGHGGDVSFTNLSFDVNDIDRCVRGIIRVKGRYPVETVAALTNLDEAEIMREIRDLLYSYPEQSTSSKLVHFLFFENNVKFSFEIEDVNRFYFWSVAPFYSVPFFNYIFNCPDKSKEKLNLYREFLVKVSPVAAAIPNSNWGCSIISKRFKVLHYILYLSFKYPKLRKFIKKVYDKRAYSYNANSKIIQCIREQVKSCNDIPKFLSLDGTEDILSNSTQYSHEAIDNLFTITSLIDENICNENLIEKYY
jgi:asparagine synthase (glutamine-hydrolysing)